MILKKLQIVNNDMNFDMNDWRQTRRIVHNARMISRCKSYFKFSLAKLFLDIKTVDVINFFFCINSFD